MLNKAYRIVVAGARLPIGRGAAVKAEARRNL